MPKTPNRPRDVNQLAKRVVDLSVGEASEDDAPAPNPAAVKRGKARAEKLTSAERSRIAKKAAEARWNKDERPGDKVRVQTAMGEMLDRIALTWPEQGHDFLVVWVCSEREYTQAKAEGRDPDGVPWPADAVFSA